MSESQISRDRVEQFWNTIRDEAGEDNQTGYLTDEWPQDFAMKRFAGELTWVKRWLDDEQQSRSSCLDVGCGTGLWLSQLAPIFDRAVGIDLSQSMIESAARMLSRKGIDNASVQCSAIQDFDESTQFDFIFLGGVLMYIEDGELDAVMQGLRRRLAPGGLLIARESTWRGTTYYREKMLAPGLFAKAGAARDAYYAIYRTTDVLRRALDRGGFTVDKVAANVDYKLNDFKEGQIKFVDKLLGGALQTDRDRADAWARRIHAMRWLTALPWYHLLRTIRIPPWKLDNHWFVCSRQ